MNKSVAHVVLLLFDLAAIYGIWWVCNETRLIHADLTAGAEVIEYNNRMYSTLAGAIVPLVHIVSLIEAFQPKAIESPFAGRLMIGTLVVLLVSALGLTLALPSSIKNNGYIHCKPLDSRMTFSTYRVYTKNISVCEELILEKRPSKEMISIRDYTIRLNREKCLVTYSRKGKSNSGHMKLSLGAPCFFMKEYNTDRVRTEYFSDNNTTVVIIAGTPVKNDPAFPISSKREDCGSQMQAAVIKGDGKFELSTIQQGSVYCPGLGAPEPSYWLFGHE